MQMSLFDFEETIEKKNSKEVALYIDGSNLLSRCFFASAGMKEAKDLMRSPDGKYTNGVLGFMRSMLLYIKTYNATHVAVCLDDYSSSEGNFRKKMYDEYKAGREKTRPELKEQYQTLDEFLSLMNIPVYKHPDYEADDLIASLVRNTPFSTYIISNDKDLLQLVDEKTYVVSRKKKEDFIYTVEAFQKEYDDLHPKQIIDLKSLEGDSSDNIKGVEGIGEKGAKQLIKKYHNLKSVFDNIESLEKPLAKYKKKLENGKESAFFSKRLATLVNKVNISPTKLSINEEGFQKRCHELALHSLKNYKF